MTEIQLTRRAYLGEGYFHYFADSGGNLVSEECTKREYERLGEVGGEQHNPLREGLTWKYSAGGTIKVDRPDGHMIDKDVVDVGERAFIRLGRSVVHIARENVVNDRIDDSLIRT